MHEVRVMVYAFVNDVPSFFFVPGFKKYSGARLVAFDELERFVEGERMGSTFDEFERDGVSEEEERLSR